MNIPPELLHWRRWLATVRTPAEKAGLLAGTRGSLRSPGGWETRVLGPSVQHVAPYLAWLWALTPAEGKRESTGSPSWDHPGSWVRFVWAGAGQEAAR